MTELKKKILFSMGGKGGVGKTTFITGLIEWYQKLGIPCSMLDLDTENKTKGSLAHFFPESAKKVDIHGNRGLDALIDEIETHSVVIADMGGSSGKITQEWFNEMYESLHSLDIQFIAIGLITPDPASIESVLQWAQILGDRVQYVIVQNYGENAHSSFERFENSIAVQRFIAALNPFIIQMDSRIPEIQNSMRDHGLTLSRVSNRESPEVLKLSNMSTILRVQGYKRKLHHQFEKIKEILS